MFHFIQKHLLNALYLFGCMNNFCNISHYLKEIYVASLWTCERQACLSFFFIIFKTCCVFVFGKHQLFCSGDGLCFSPSEMSIDSDRDSVAESEEGKNRDVSIFLLLLFHTAVIESSSSCSSRSRMEFV